MGQCTLCGMLVDSGEKAKFMVVYAILLAILPALNASPANQCQHKFQPGISYKVMQEWWKVCHNIFIGVKVGKKKIFLFLELRSSVFMIK